MSAANGRSAERRLRRRRRKLAAATSTVLLVAVAVAGEPISLAASATQVAGGIGGGLDGLRDPSSVGASGRVNEDDEIGDDLLDGADDPNSLLKLGGDAPSEGGDLDIPGIMLDAYMQAADTLATTAPNCRLDWSLLASIGRIESNHARNGRVDTEGNTVPNILGPVLNGGGFAAIQDTDGGALDGDGRWDRAVGAMQFIPSTWAGYRADGNDDGVMSPHNVFDATLAAGKYLCSGGLDLSNPQDRAAAVFRYNHSDSYVATVLLWADAYAEGVTPMDTDPVLPEDEENFALGPPSIGDLPPAPTSPPVTTTPPPAPNPNPNPNPNPSPQPPSPVPKPTLDSTTTCPTPPTTTPETTDPTTTDPTPSTTEPTPTESTTPTTETTPSTTETTPSTTEPTPTC